MVEPDRQYIFYDFRMVESLPAAIRQNHQIQSHPYRYHAVYISKVGPVFIAVYRTGEENHSANIHCLVCQQDDVGSMAMGKKVR